MLQVIQIFATIFKVITSCFSRLWHHSVDKKSHFCPWCRHSTWDCKKLQLLQTFFVVGVILYISYKQTTVYASIHHIIGFWTENKKAIMSWVKSLLLLNGDTELQTVSLKKFDNKNVMPQWVMWICSVWPSVESKIGLMSDLMSRSWEIKAVHNFQPASIMTDVDDNGSHVNANLFS